MTSKPSSLPTSQYQHFIPQFLLRNFAHPYKPPKKKDGNRRREEGLFRNEPAVHNIDLCETSPEVIETPVKQILGGYDYYQDKSKPIPEQRHIEKLLSRLESQASAIFAKIKKHFAKGDTEVWLTRDERNLIRKFLFILKYRGSTLHARFYHDNNDDYEYVDRKLLFKYMREKGFERPSDVWFHNIKTFAELDMDPQMKWMQRVTEEAYHDDAQWFISHTQKMYLAICAIQNQDDEFILTDNTYNVFEGPCHAIADPKTGKLADYHAKSFHEFAPISPKLMIVLRSHVFSVPEEDADPAVKACRKFWRSVDVDLRFGPETTSYLANLPVSKARNSYSVVVDGRLRPVPGSDGRRRADDKFYFRYFNLDAEHVNMINAVLFDTTLGSERIIFGSTRSFLRTLEWYLTAPCDVIKVVCPLVDDHRLTVVGKLAGVAAMLGS
ncbi:hypothetical protein QBC46DRAFT_71322 [Diplogelasinospora grovesii]|uniref:DUF4238 domain-containing protein n=1 Tax=Diplogelasinospora grovesii TaxID=303347 RepID=A0AAN6MWA8_9PEZI|nr:hypothetical protein QBC46DRAFT_71322 [Diplogelasinospora grovesii]